nr:MAG TPA: hypothetical protein [Caudoviricetes sp.]
MAWGFSIYRPDNPDPRPWATNNNPSRERGNHWSITRTSRSRGISVCSPRPRRWPPPCA